MTFNGTNENAEIISKIECYDSEPQEPKAVVKEEELEDDDDNGSTFPIESIKVEQNSDYELSQSDIEKEFVKSEPFLPYEDEYKTADDNSTAYKCRVCSEEFKVFLEYKLHRKQHFIDKRTCSMCHVVCQSIGKLEIHMNAHLGLRPYKCEECGKNFSSKHQVKLHGRSHSDEKRYPCTKCSRAFRYLGSLRSHMIQHTEIKNEFKCKTCGKTSIDLQSHRKHLEQHGQKVQIKCELCNQVFSSDRVLQTHLNSHTELKFPCEHCGRIYVSLYRLKRHIKRAHIPSVCEDCKQIFYDRAMYTKHRKQHGEDKPIICPHCDKHFDKVKNLAEHIRLQHKEDGKMHKCYLCDKEFINAPLLKNHIKTHDKCFKCKDCGKLFSSRYNLETHSVTHTGERNHKCDICEKSYTTKTSLKNHRAIHTETRDFKCKQCPKTFKTNRRLYVHKLSHATEEKYECEICHSRFRVKQYLKYHMIKHSSEKPFECQVCNKKFKHKKSWEKHLAHDRHWKLNCDYCSEILPTKNALAEHIKLCHDNSSSQIVKESCNSSNSSDSISVKIESELIKTENPY